ncbi:MAG TPA: ATP-dependent DNA ligase, partial [Chloroflexota bacterium]|nr:ATP-dependent DNA ligase [Chloroflexota bacterium]
QLTRELPSGDGWHYEPKWDGFRALVFWDGDDLLIQSRDLRPLGRYFPELEQGLREHLPPGCVVDGEIVIAGPSGLDFDALLLRIHPAASRVRLLASQTPAYFVAFDLLCADFADAQSWPQVERRARLEALLAGARSPVFVTPATTDRAQAAQWFERFEGAGLDGVVAKRLDGTYTPGQRVMLKIKHQRTADCVVGAFRWNRGQVGTSVGSLLLGLYDASGTLHHVGFTSSFKAAEKRDLVTFLEPYRELDPARPGFMGPPPDDVQGWPGGGWGGQSRWSHGKEVMDWNPLRPDLVCEVAFDHWQGDPEPPTGHSWLGGGRFRHGTTFLRWRSDKPPYACGFDQLTFAVPIELSEVFGSHAATRRQ